MLKKRITMSNVRKSLYIFLDVDGVLNKQSDWVNKFSIDLKCVEALFLCVEDLKKNNYIPKIVLCSTWRAGKGDNRNSLQYDSLQAALAEYGMTIFDTTPISNKGRQAEVEYYIRRNGVESYIIIDDDISLYEESDKINIYVPNYKTGLTKSDINLIIKQIL